MSIRPMKKDTAEQLADARSILIGQYPYWGVEIHSIPWYAVNSLAMGAATAVSGTGVGFIREDMIRDWEPHRFATEILHEFMHVCSLSVYRMLLLGMLELKHVHNLAQDLAINAWIVREMQTKKGLRELPGWVLPSMYGFPDDLSYEEYFALFANNMKKLGLVSIQTPGVGSGHCNCGSNLADDLAREALSSGLIPKLEREDLAKRSLATLADLGKQLAKKAEEAGALDRNIGKGSLHDLLGVSKQDATIPWNVYARRWLGDSFVYNRGHGEFMWSRPARRAPFQTFMPRTRTRTPSVIAAIDTSGSMYGSGISEAASELFAIARSIGFKLHTLFCDDAITNVADISSWQDVVDNSIGGGGTGFLEVFEYIAKLPSARRPKTLVFVTDGWIDPSDLPSKVPEGLRVLWVITSHGRNVPVSWGDQIKVGQRVKV